MYSLVVASACHLLTTLFAYLLTFQAKSLELDPDSIGSTERFYRQWTTPIYMWCASYLSLIVYVALMAFVLARVGK